MSYFCWNIALTYFVAYRNSFLRYMSVGSVCCLLRYSATCLAGNSVSHTYPKSLARWIASPSTKELSKVTFAAFRLPAGRGRPILSSLLLNIFPPSLDFALNIVGLIGNTKHTWSWYTFLKLRQAMKHWDIRVAITFVVLQRLWLCILMLMIKGIIFLELNRKSPSEI